MPDDKDKGFDLGKGLSNVGYALSKGAAAFGQGLTGTDYLSSFENMEARRAELEEENKKIQNANKAINTLVETLPEDKQAAARAQLNRLPPKDVLEIAQKGAERALGFSGPESVPEGATFIGPGGVVMQKGPGKDAEQAVQRQVTAPSLTQDPNPNLDETVEKVRQNIDEQAVTGEDDRPALAQTPSGPMTDVKLGPGGEVKGGKRLKSRQEMLAEAEETGVAGAFQQELKTESQKARDFRRVRNKADIIMGLANRAYNKSDKLLTDTNKALAPFGIQLERGEGLLGRMYGQATRMQGKLGYNEFVGTYDGLMTEVGAAVMRMSIPARSAFLVGQFKATLPPLSGNPKEDVSQISETLTNGFADKLATAVGPDGKPVMSKEEQIKAIREFLKNSYATFSKALGIDYDGELYQESTDIEPQKRQLELTKEELEKVENFQF